MRSKFFGNRLLDTEFNKAYLCPPPPPTDEEVAKLKSEWEASAKKAKEDEIAKIKAEHEEALKKLKPPADDPGLEEKARKEREAKEKSQADSKVLEAALKFSLGAKEWLKTNASLLPKDVAGIFEAAEKENYTSAIEKDGAIKAALIKSFFDVQANLDLLTTTQKTGLEDWLKLTKNGRQDQAQKVYDSIFEPTLEMLKRIKKAEQLNTGGKEQTDGEKALAERMMNLSKKHYLGEKANA